MNSNKHIKRISSAAIGALVLVLFVLSMTPLQAQGWEQYTGVDVEFDEIHDIVAADDYGFLASGYTDKNLAIYRFDPDGNIIWSREDLGSNNKNEGLAIIETADGDIVVAGYCSGCGAGSEDAYIIKLDKYGQIIWDQNYGGGNNDRAVDVLESTNGNLIVLGSFQNSNGEDDIFILNIDPANGTILSDTTYNLNGQDRPAAFLESSIDNSLIITGFTGPLPDATAFLFSLSSTADSLWFSEFGTKSVGFDVIESQNGAGIVDGYAFTGYNGNNKNIYLARTDLSGNEQWTRNYGGDFGDEGQALMQTKDGGYLVAGSDELSAVLSLPVLVKTTSSGETENLVHYGDSTNFNLINARAKGLALANDGGYVIAGFRTGSEFIPDLNGFALRVAPDLGYATNVLQGKAFFDFDGDCQLDNNEFGFEDWMVTIKGAKDFYQSTDVEGNFSLNVDADTYEVTLIPPSDYWVACINGYDIVFNDSYDTTTLLFPIQVDKQCAYLEVDASAPYLVPCTSTDYIVHYCNKGTIGAEDAFIDVELDEALGFIGASQSPIFLGGNTYRFEVGTVGVMNCDSIRISVSVDCNAVEGQTHCLNAHIFPDTLCISPINWDGSSVAVEGTCEGGELKFNISNKGSDMNETQSFVIVEDDLMYFNNPIEFSLMAAEEIEIDPIPANGKTFRLIAEQSKNHPGRSMPTIAIEGCTDGGGPFSTGFYTSFAEDDADNFIVKDCQENIPSNSTPSNSKRGYPKGYGADRLIAPETELKYIVNFENTGPNTAIRVVVRDTLSPFLDPASVRPGASSHGYSFEVYGEGILNFTFDDITLNPGSSAGSNGFVKYTVSQKPDNPVGALIKNSAAIFFDFGNPIDTDNTCHKVGEDFVTVSTSQIFQPTIEAINIFPNPFREMANVEIVGGQELGEVSFSIYDANGKMVYRKFDRGNNFQISGSSLAAGFYFYQLESEGLLLSTGKVVVQ